MAILKTLATSFQRGKFTSTVLLLLFFALAETAAQPVEQMLKAAFLYRFAQFIEWPQSTFTSTSSELVLCVYGHNRFQGALKSIEGKAVGEHHLTSRDANNISQIDSCHILYISSTSKDALAKLLQHSHTAHVLTVSDLPGFAESGGIIGLVQNNDRYQFEVNIDAAEQAGLALSSHLLKLAKEIHKGSKG